jgi:hypothetical protein
MRIVARNVSTSMALPDNGRIELAFDRYLVPFTVTRQTFALHDLLMRFQTPDIAYDPVARIVTITPTTTTSMPPLQADQTYVINIDPKVLRGIDGATIDPRDATIEFPVIAGDAGAPQPAPPTVDFCTDILPVFTAKCALSSCHGPVNPPAGLRLDSPMAIAATAVGRVAQGANTGPRARPQPPSAIFGLDMPIIDPGSGAGASSGAGNSWLMYKLLLAVPSASAMPNVGCDGGVITPTDVSMIHLVEQPAFADPANDPARATLSNNVLGREMPFPSDPGASLQNAGGAPLTIDELERVSRWIAQPLPDGGALVPPNCACTQ